MAGLAYESFVIKAFEISLNKKINRGDDPAHLSNANYYNINDKEFLNKIKTGTAYAIAIYNSEIQETKKVKDPDDYNKMNAFLDKALIATNTNDIDSLIADYNEFRKYANNLPNII